MKTKELIRRLNEADPSGECEVVVGQSDIYFAARQPMYYDGFPVLLVRDESKAPYYDVVGVRYGSGGQKVQLRTMGLEDALLDHPELPVTYETESDRSRFEPMVERAREDARRLIAEVDADIAASKVTT